MFRPSLAVALVCLALSVNASQHKDIGDTAHWTGESSSVDSVNEIKGELYGGARFAPGVVGEGFLFDGVDDALNLPDDRRLRFSRSLTIKGWIKCFAYPSEERVAGQIVFRGDERSGLDPYHLTLHHDGTLYFTVESGTEIAHVKAPFPLGKFVYVTASLDDSTGLLRLMYGRKVVDETITKVRPFRDLDARFGAGVGIGNHCRQPESMHNQPFRGIIDELTLSGKMTLTLESLNVSPTDRGTATIEARLAVPSPPEGASIRLACAGGLKAPAELRIPARETRGRVEVPISASVTTWSLTGEYNGSRVNTTFAAE